MSAEPTLILAYLDPGTGSIVVQLVLAGVAGSAYVLKLYWRRMKSFVLHLTRNQPPDVDPT